MTDRAPERRHPLIRFLKALVSMDSYGLVLLLLVISYCTAAMWVSSWAYSVVLLIEIFTVFVALRVSQAHRRLRRVSFALMVIAGAVAIFNAVGGDEALAFVFAIAGILYAIAPFSIIRHLATRPGVDQETMLGAICAYLLFGIAFAFLYREVAALQFPPTPFFESAAEEPTMAQVLFFSFTTLTTTGYGNLVPAGNPGQTLAVSEMILGQLFLITALGKIVTEWQPRRWQGRSADDADPESIA